MPHRVWHSPFFFSAPRHEAAEKRCTDSRNHLPSLYLQHTFHDKAHNFSDKGHKFSEVPYNFSCKAHNFSDNGNKFYNYAPAQPVLPAVFQHSPSNFTLQAARFKKKLVYLHVENYTFRQKPLFLPVRGTSFHPLLNNIILHK